MAMRTLPFARWIQAFKAVLFVAVAVLFIGVPVVRAQSTDAWFAPTLEKFGKVLDKAQTNKEVQKEGYDAATGGNGQALLACQIGGCSANPQSAFYYGNSVLAHAGSAMAQIYLTPPANLALWIRSTGEDLGFYPKRAYAQGVGFAGLSVLLPIWKQMRNIAYMVLAIVIVAIGFLVMFRKKIDPKTVVTVQSALPNIIVTLILITFSYAIAGILIDLMYLVMGVSVAAIVSASGGTLTMDAVGKYMNGNFGTVVLSMGENWLRSADDIIAMTGFGYGGLATGGILGAIALAASAPGVAAIAIAAPILGVLIVFLALLFAIARVLFLLVGAYIQIIIGVIFAPVQLAFGALPGSTSFESWLKNMIANLAVFPVTAIMLVISRMLVSFAQNPMGGGTAVWGPPLLAPSGGSAGLGGLIGIGVMFTIPSIAAQIKESLKAKPAVQAGVGAILGPVGQGGAQILQMGYQVSMVAPLIKGVFGGGGDDSHGHKPGGKK